MIKWTTLCKLENEKEFQWKNGSLFELFQNKSFVFQNIDLHLHFDMILGDKVLFPFSKDNSCCPWRKLSL